MEKLRFGGFKVITTRGKVIVVHLFLIFDYNFELNSSKSFEYLIWFSIKINF